MNISKNKFILSLCVSFILGSIVTYFISDYIHLKSTRAAEKIVNDFKKNDLDNFLKHKKSRQINPDDIFDQMRKRMDKALRDGLLGGMQIDKMDLGGMGSDGIEIEESEDDNFKYIIISAKGLNKDAIEINIANGMISISGEIKKIEESRGSRSSYISSFSRKFNIPHGVREENVKVDTKKDKIIMKFEKYKV